MNIVIILLPHISKVPLNCLMYTSKIRMIKLENVHKYSRKKHVNRRHNGTLNLYGGWDWQLFISDAMEINGQRYFTFLSYSWINLVSYTILFETYSVDDFKIILIDCPFSKYNISSTMTGVPWYEKSQWVSKNLVKISLNSFGE